MSTNHKKIFSIILLLSIPTSFSEEEKTDSLDTTAKVEAGSTAEKEAEVKTGVVTEVGNEAEATTRGEAGSKTEAGAACLDQNCLSEKTALHSLKNTLDDQVCRSMQEKPECKGVNKRHLKGCVNFSGPFARGIARPAEGVVQCTVGLFEGVGGALTDILRMVRLPFTSSYVGDGKDLYDMKTYLHAEFESAAQDSGETMAALETAGATIELFYDAMSDVYSCLNPLGLTQKVCQFITAFPINASLGTFMTPAVSVGLLTIPITDYVISHAVGSDSVRVRDAARVFSSMAAVATLGFVATANAKASIMASIPLGLITGGIGTMARHDVQVRGRVKERMRDKIKEFKEQEKK